MHNLSIVVVHVVMLRVTAIIVLSMVIIWMVWIPMCSILLLSLPHILSSLTIVLRLIGWLSMISHLSYSIRMNLSGMLILVVIGIIHLHVCTTSINILPWSITIVILRVLSRILCRLISLVIIWLPSGGFHRLTGLIQSCISLWLDVLRDILSTILQAPLEVDEITLVKFDLLFVKCIIPIFISLPFLFGLAKHHDLEQIIDQFLRAIHQTMLTIWLLDILIFMFPLVFCFVQIEILILL